MADVLRAPTGPNDLVNATGIVNAFAVDVLHQAAGNRNLVFSPASIVTALAMARAGARGDTAVEMDTVLHAPDLAGLLGAMNALDIALVSRGGWFLDPNTDPPVRHEVTLRSVNAPFAQTGYPLQPAYLDALAASFGAGLREVDFRADPPGAKGEINGWVSDRTEARIPALLSPADITRLTRLVLVNAIYLKAPWTNPFDPGDTQSGQFTRADGTTVEVPMMHLVSSNTGPTFPAARGKGWVAVRLPYLGDELAMTIIVPDNLRTFESSLSPRTLTQLTQVTWESDREGLPAYNRVDLAMPKFSLKTATDLAETLQALGMPAAFDPSRADFTGIASPDQTGEPGLYIAKVIHEANIDVDEKGTEAAAATAVDVATAGPGDQRKPVVIRADQPFLFVLTDVKSGTVLFIGRVADPSTR